MSWRNFIKNNVTDVVMDPEALSSAIDTNSTRLDMSGYEGVVFILPITDSVATGVVTITAEQNIIDSDSGMAALTGASATDTDVGGDALNNQILVLEIVKPEERYIQCVLTSSVANIATGNMIAIRYTSKKDPIVEGSTVLDSTLVISPAEA
jgi:hypothetical protein